MEKSSRTSSMTTWGVSAGGASEEAKATGCEEERSASPIDSGDADSIGEDTAKPDARETRGLPDDVVEREDPSA